MAEPDSNEYLQQALILARGVEFLEQPDMASWEVSEADLELTFPENHKNFVSAFGSGYFGSDLYLMNPCAYGIHKLSRARLEEFRAEHTHLLRGFGDQYWRKLYPEAEGLILVADNLSRTSLFLNLQASEPRLVVLDFGFNERLEYRMSLAEFLCRLFKAEMSGRWETGFRKSLWGKAKRAFFTSRVTHKSK